MNVLFITRKVCESDWLAGFTCEWIESLSEKIDRLEILCLEKGEYSLPLPVHSMGKERGNSRLMKLLNFHRCLVSLTPDIDVVFCHMNPIYAVLAAPYVRYFGKNLVFWYAHGHVSWLLKLAARLSDQVLTSTPEGFNIRSPKPIIMGQGVDIRKFSPAAPIKNRKKSFQIVSVGRISPVKNLSLLIEAVGVLEDKNIFLTLVGGAGRPEDETYIKSLRSLLIKYGLEDNVRFSGAVPRFKMPSVYRQADLFCTMSDTGSLDKVIIEAMACGVPVVGGNSAFKAIARANGLDECVVDDKDPVHLAGAIERIRSLPRDKRQKIADRVRKIAAEHDLDRLTDKFVEVFRQLSGHPQNTVTEDLPDEYSAPPDKPLHILMISLGESILQNQELGDTLERHRRYAAAIGRLSMIVYAPHFTRSPARRIDSHLKIIPARAKTRLGFLFAAFQAAQELSRENMPDMITTQDPFGTALVGYFLKRKLNVPLEVQNHSDFFDNQRWISQKPFLFSAFNVLGKWIIKRADSLRVINYAEAEKYRNLGIPKNKIKVIPTPVNLTRFLQKSSDGAMRELDRRWGLNRNDKILLWVGRAVWFKRIPILLQCVLYLQQERENVRCLIVGDGPELDFWKNWAARLGLGRRVIFTGHVSHSDLPAYLRRCHMLVHPSIYEGFGKTMAEASASAKPVVATRTAGAREIIVDKVTGLLAELENPQDLADKINTLLDNPKKTARMGQAARERVLEKFDRDRAIDSIVSSWREVTEGCA